MLFQRNKFNKYDYAIMICISSLVFGNMGGALQPIRIITLLFSPFIFINLTKMVSESKEIAKCLIFFIFWYIYAIITLFITSDVTEGLKQLLYYFCHFSLFFLLIIFSEKAKLPLRSIIYGWVFFFLLTSPIALNEIINYQHLNLSFVKENININIGQGVIVQKRFASVTFVNYNDYVLTLCYTLPFLLGFILFANTVKRQIIGFMLLFLLSFFLLTNASRGGILCLLSSIIVFIFSYRNAKIKYKIILILFITISIIVIYKYSDIFLSQLEYRFIDRSNLFTDSRRLFLIEIMWKLLTESWYVGTGIGSMVESLTQANAGEILIGHNLFFEVLMQYGIIIFIWFCYFLFNIYKNGVKTKDNTSRFIIFISFFCFMISSVIISGYLLMPAFWVFLASIYIIAFNRTEKRY